LELATGARWGEQEKLCYLVSRHCDLKKNQAECGRMVAQEKSIVGFRDLIKYQQLAAKTLLEPATNQLLTVLSKNWLN
jgi:hypothetical protein